MFILNVFICLNIYICMYSLLLVAVSGEERSDWLEVLNNIIQQYYQPTDTNTGMYTSTIPASASSPNRSSTNTSTNNNMNVDISTLSIHEVSRIMDVLTIYGPKKPNVAKDGCVAIAQLARSNDFNKAKLGQVGMCAVLIDILKVYMTDKDIAIEGLKAITELAKNNSENRVKLSAAGGCRVALELLQNNSMDVSIATHGCAAIRNLSTHGENKAKLEQSGAGAVIIHTIDVHRLVAAVAVEVCMCVIMDVCVCVYLYIYLPKYVCK